MSEQKTDVARQEALDRELPPSGGNRGFDRGLVEGLECAARCLESHPAEALGRIRELIVLAGERERTNRHTMASLDTPDGREEVERRLADIRSGKVKMVPMEGILRELGMLKDDGRNGAPPT